MQAVPVIDVGALVGGSGSVDEVAASLDQACRDVGFFVAVGHGIDPARLEDLLAAARSFFALPEEQKAEIEMARAGRAWRGWFPLGGELTSGVPDGKEGIYFGEELPPSDRLLHGPNLFPARPPELRPAVIRSSMSPRLHTKPPSTGSTAVQPLRVRTSRPGVPSSARIVSNP